MTLRIILRSMLRSCDHNTQLELYDPYVTII